MYSTEIPVQIAASYPLYLSTLPSVCVCVFSYNTHTHTHENPNNAAPVYTHTHKHTHTQNETLQVDKLEGGRGEVAFVPPVKICFEKNYLETLKVC